MANKTYEENLLWFTKDKDGKPLHNSSIDFVNVMIGMGKFDYDRYYNEDGTRKRIQRKK